MICINHNTLITIFDNQQSMSLQIGGVIFKRKQYQTISSSFCTDKKIMRNLIRCSQWKIQHNDFKTDKWNILFPIMLESIVEKMDLKLTYFSPVLQSICHIKFPNLMELNLQVNQIKSIEPLVSLKAPILEKLNLLNNRIVSLKPLSKMNCKYLKTLLVGGNEIKDFYPMTLANFPKCMEKIIFQNWQQSKMQVVGMTFFFKLVPKQIKGAYMLFQRENRINNQKSIEMLRQKYSKITLN